MTLDQAKKALLFQARDLSNTPMPLVVAQVSNYMKSSTLVGVEDSAVMFYLLNQTVGNISTLFNKDEELPADAENVVQLYLNDASNSSIRLFYYILLVITREIRHLHQQKTEQPKWVATYGEHLPLFIKSLSGLGSHGAVNFLLDTCSNGMLDQITLGDYVKVITDLFNTGKFSGGYGGKPWGKIAETLRKMVYGETSIEIMNDTAWTLAHNNGPMFNKGLFYKSYTPVIYKVLDVQRSGQIPELIYESLNSGLFGKEVISTFKLCSPFFKREVALGVDWYLVESLGSLKTYHAEKVQQTKASGVVVPNKPSKLKNVNSVNASNTIYVNNNQYAVIIDYKRKDVKTLVTGVKTWVTKEQDSVLPTSEVIDPIAASFKNMNYEEMTKQGVASLKTLGF
jgi:hypothetical protein